MTEPQRCAGEGKQCSYDDSRNTMQFRGYLSFSLGTKHDGFVNPSYHDPAGPIILVFNWLKKPQNHSKPQFVNEI